MATIIAVLLLCAAAAWIITAIQSASMGMGGMAMLGAGLFVVIWVVMMVAMMFPSVTPMVLAHAAIVRSRGGGSLPTVGFVAGYLLVWTAAGLVPLAALEALNQMLVPFSASTLVRLGGAVILLAGVYQFTPLKNACLKSCRSPMGFIMTHDFGGGTPGAARAGMSHGLYCLGCCWALMAVLAVVGLMNLAWMAVIAVVFFLEKNWSYGVPLTRVVGTVCIVGGLAVVVSPNVLSMVGGPMV
jgi:predicted metal-binding membrane protein